MKPLREIRPRPRPPEDAAAGPLNANRVARRSRVGKTPSACDPCRRRKIKCDGALPRCLMCVTRRESCTYTYSIRHTVTVAEGGEVPEHGSLNDVLESLKIMPYDEALEWLRKLRQGAGNTPSPTAPPSEVQLLRGMLPPTPNILESELSMRHNVAYPALPPISFTPALGNLLRPLAVHQPGRQEMSPPRQYPLIRDSESSVSGEEMFTPDSAPKEFDDECISQPLFDERLGKVDISLWTAVSIPNELAVCVLSHYFEVDHPVFPLFDQGLFVNDLAEHRNHFCSSFLVNSLLCWACKSYTPISPEPAKWSLRLFIQAQKDLAGQQLQNTLTTVAGLQLLGISAVTYGKNDLSLQFTRRSVELGRSMGLFDVKEEKHSAIQWLRGHTVWTRAASCTAWGVFNWVSLLSLHYHTCEIGAPPLLPKPWELLAGEPTEGIYADAPHPLQVFYASSFLWAICQDMLCSYYGTKKERPRVQGKLDFAEGIYLRLLQWANTLPPYLVRNKDSTHEVMMMHIYFHAIVTDLFRPFLTPPTCNLRLNLFSSHHATPKAVYAASVNQLKRLCLLFRLRYKKARFSGLWQTAVIYVANAMMQEATQSNIQHQEPGREWRFYLDLCLAGLTDLCVSFSTSGAISRAVVGMALQNGALKPAEANRILIELKRLEMPHEEARLKLNGNTEATWVIDLDLALTDIEAARGQSLVQQFENMMLASEFPHDDIEYAMDLTAEVSS
ncbi:fungal specific transcription factor domain-containing protein [Colletotrichum kahawae]|uniref:Fungal specific transcription factor domain-containing protein n=1 Tax=Colletotrichum kahawae TaxID=34407 RepID=A0AAE0D4K9_COLKA|nr:fungal specific transcription factor domain-containing protein [Colletotrichum kahawae]